jgi:hypothetical protein
MKKTILCSGLSSPVTEKFEIQMSAGKLMLTNFRYSQGLILETFGVLREALGGRRV